MPLFIWAATWPNQQNGCATSEDSDQPGHPPSLIRVFAVRSVRTAKTGRMSRLIWVFAGRTLILLFFSCRGSYLRAALKFILSLSNFLIYSRCESVQPCKLEREKERERERKRERLFVGCFDFNMCERLSFNDQRGWDKRAELTWLFMQIIDKHGW